MERVIGLTVVTADLAGAAQALEGLLDTAGVPEPSSDEAAGIGEMLRFWLGDHRLDLACPTGKASPAGRYLREFGEEVYEVVLGGDNGSERRLLPSELTHSARIHIQS